MIFTPTQLEYLLNIIEVQYGSFIGTHFGTDYLSSQDKELLRRHGVDVDNMYDETKDHLQTSFKFGILSDVLSEKEAKSMSFKDIEKYIKTGSFVPLNQREKASLESIKFQALTDVKAQKNKIFEDFNGLIAKENRERRSEYEKIIRDEVYRGKKDRKSVNQITSDLGHKTGDWSRNFGRIVEYVSHAAFNEGRASLYERKYGDEAKMWFSVYSGACKHCIRLYLTNGIGSKPKVFTVSELRDNGSNIGRKPSDWLPTLYGVHPHCRCTANELPPGMEWDEDKGEFVQGKKYKKVERKSKVKVQVGDETYEV